MKQTLTDTEALTITKLQEYKSLIDTDIAEYSDQLLANWERDYGTYSRDGFSAFTEILSRGGKRLRGALVLNAYEMCGGTDQKLALSAARVLEMIHAYVLIVDDICDRSDMRRGGPTAHRLLEQYHRQSRLHGDSEHFGVSQAMNAAVAGAHEAMLALGKLPIAPELTRQLQNRLNETLITTANGQFNDIFNEALQDVDEEQVKKVLTWKTAYYSFWNPLEIGALLAGSNESDLKVLEQYSVNAGLSFQITDDILGTFGDSFESGKSAMDDIREGKVTILIARALARANSAQKRHILAALGNRDLSTDDYNDCRVVIEQTGALEYTKQMADMYAKGAVTALDTVPAHWEQTNVLFLHGLARYITKRTT